MSYFKQIRYIKNSPPMVFCFFFLMLTFLVTIFSIPIAFFKDSLPDISYRPNEPSFDFKNNPILDFLMVIVIAPLLETLLNQYLVIEILSTIKYFKKRKLLVVMLSAFIFGVVHSYSISYMINMFFVGYILAIAFLLKMKQGYAFGYVTFIHAIRNFVVFIFVWIEK
jgi:uncharacterized protein